ncbi:MAG: VaFE repeat-containing surface-anchored protein [Firmicutes bacterium]|nr:VaFE repeat-containing surface-anchored protein [Bacillota bacterium]
MDRLRGPPVLKAGNKQQTDPVRFSDGISHKKGMTMNLKNKKGKRLTSTLMAVLMSVSTTLTPVNTMASELETSSAAVESTLEETTAETQVQTVSETAVSKTQEQTTSETAASEAQTSASEMQPVPETTEEVCTEEVQTFGEGAEETSANETRGPDETQENETTAEFENETEEVTETEMVEETSSEEPTIDLSVATREDIISYIEAIGGDESDAFYSFIGGLGEYDYQLVWMAQYGAQEDQLLESFGFDYDAASDLDVAKYIHKLSEEELADFTESMTFEQYRRYLSIREMMAEMDEKDFADVIDEEEFTADLTWDYESYDAFAESLTGVSLQRTEQTMQFYNTYVDPSKVQAGVTTIDGLLDANADWYSNDYILSLNPEMFKENVPVYHGADGNYYVVSTVPTLNGFESADYQPATSFYNGGVEAQAFTDIEYLGNGVYRIPSSRYQYCFTEQYVSDMGTLYGISFGLRIQVLYGFTPSGEITIAADVVYPDMTERFLPAKLNLLAGIATVRVFNDDYEDSVDNYLVSASINRGAGLPDSVGSMNEGKVLQFVVGDANAVASLDVLIGYNVTSKYSMAAEVTTAKLIGSASGNENINLAAEMYNGAYLKLDQGSVPKNLAVGDKFIYANTALTITGVTTAYDGRGGMHIGATEVPTHDAQSFCLYNGKGVEPQISSWFKTKLNTNSADPGYMVQMTAANISKRASYNGSSVNLGGNKIFGYRTDGLGAVSGTDGKVLNLEGTNVLLSCMHAWGNESASTPQDIVDAISTFTGRTQKDYAIDEGFGHYHPNVALQCTDVHDGGDGNMYATFKVVTSMLQVGGVVHPQNYQCAFATISIVYPSAPKNGYLKIHKSSENPEVTDKNSCYKFEGIRYGIFTDEACVNNLVVLSLDANGYSQPYELPEGTYYVREAGATPGSGYQTNGTVYTVNVTAETTADAPVICETTDVPLNDPLGIQINKINSDGTTTADLSGAEYTITYYPKQYTSVEEIKADPDVKPTVWVIQTLKAANGNYRAMLDDAHIVPNSNSAGAVFGKNHTGTYVIPLGTITVEETKAPAGFTKDGAVVSSAKTDATISGTNNVYLFQLVDENSAVYLKSGNALSTSLDDETAVTLTYAERQINGSPKMEKHDFELNKKAAMGGTSFEGISFEIYCLDESVIIGNDTYTKGQTITTVTSDAEGNIDVGMQFPVGHYAVREKAANNYYTMTTDQIHYFDVVEYQGEAVIQYESDTNAVTFMDRVVRGDLSFVKKNSDTDEALAYIPFRITNNTTGETHYILTDANGNFTSATGKTTNTNANDAVLSQYGDKDVIPQSAVDSLAKDAGLWFGMGSEETMTSANDSYGAFVYGTYTITELKTEATRSMKMYTSTFTIDTDGKVLDLGTVNNVPMGIKTTLVDVNGEHFTEPISSITLTDHVAYKNLDTDKTYTLTGTLYVKEGDALTELMTETVDFTPSEKDGIQDVTFTFDASALVGKSVVAFEELSVNGEFCAEHKDKDDENQTVTFPGIQTTARDNVTEDHVSNATDSITIVDTVAYTGLKKGDTYTVTGTLMDAETGEAALDDDGNVITTSKEFTAPFADGSIDITFTFAGVSLSGKTFVAFEQIDHDGKKYAVHADINDKGQTVYIPKIHTKALDANTGLNQVLADSNATVVDTVTYTHLLPGKTYVMKGVLMTSAGNALMVNGNTITASTEFVPTTPDGTVDVIFTFDASVVAPKTVVAFETLTYKKIQIAVHADIEDKDQTVYIPKVRTTAIADDTKDHVTEAKKEVTIVDTVFYEGLEVDKEYTVKGVLINKATGKVITVNGKEVTAESTFTVKAQKGTVDVTFKFDGSALEDTMIVVFETLYTEGKEVGIHAEIGDEAQTVYLPKIRTHAKDGITKIDHTEALPKATIIDTVIYSSLLPGKEYTITGTLMNKVTGEAVLIDGKKVTASTIFTAEKAEGNVDIVFEFDASAIAGTTVVAFESMEYKGIEVAVHADIEDEKQTVYIPDVHTTATATDTEDHVTGANKEVTITDEVALTGLKVGNEYTVKGVLMDKTTGKELLVDEKQIVSEETFVADKADMTITLTYTLDASKLAGTTTVVFETLYTEGKEVGRHHEIDDEGQTVYIPEIHTTAADQKNGINHTEANEKATIVDTVYYSHLLPGKEYTVHGKLMDKKTGEAILIDGKEITASTTFTAEKSEGNVDVIFTFDASANAPTTVVAFEHLEYKGIEIAVHADIEDEDQTVYIPEIGTTALGQDTEDNIEKAKEDAVIVDTVEYKGLEVGREYVMTGKLVDKVNGEVITDAEGNEITASETFIAEEKDGSIDITFKFDSFALAGKSLVAFESLTTEGKEVAVHADLTDEGQTVRIPEIHTTATDKVTGDHDGVVANETTVLDEVFYKNLILGKEYTVSGKLMVKETGEPLLIDGKEVTTEKTFVAEEADGSIILEFTFDSSALAGKKIVAFEDITYEGISIGSHEDLTDDDQTISYPEIRTTAVNGTDGSKTMVLGTNVTLVDTVTYKGLTEGKTYVLKGTIMDKASGQPIGVTAETTFTAEASDGSAEVTFTFDTTKLQGKTLVVFETMYDTQGNPIVDHSDLNDEDQTVSVPVQPVIPPVVTGDDSSPMPYVLSLLAALAAAVAVVAVLVRRKRKQA